jgi:ankyrin repeat protein
VDAILSHGAEVNATDRDGYSALMYPAQNGNDAMVKLLIHHGASVNLNRGESALRDLPRPYRPTLRKGTPDDPVHFRPQIGNKP